MSKKQDKGRKVKVQRVRLRGDASEEAALRLEELARGLRSGAVQLANGDTPVEVPAGSDLTWEVKARAGRSKSRVKIDIRWRKPDEDEESPGDPLATGSNAQSANPRLSQDLENPAW